MNLRIAVCLFLLAPLAQAVHAEAVSCPDLSVAVQVGTCPPEDELRYTFSGYCSDNARMYRGENEVCTDYQKYRKLKNVVMWESADGRFHSYVSCDLPAATLRQAKPVSMKVAKQGKINRLTCGYGEDIAFTWRSREECKIPGTGNCATAASSCTADCK